MSTQMRRLWPPLIWVLACIACWFGWKLYWFLLDDAFIAFRYISNRQLGYGYTWNAPPFLPVEGYTSFLWIVLLDAIWTLFGVEPPQSANVVSLICAFASLALVALWICTRWSGIAPRASQAWALSWVLALVVTNRSFLMWSSSGLETALFNALILLWCFLAMGLVDRPRVNTTWICLVACLLTLARPDGLVYWLATLAMLLVMHVLHVLPARALLVRALPLLGTVAHLAWRHEYYGSWLPNTYYAKVVAPWPTAGFNYLASFVLEYALWIWLGVVLFACARWLRTHPPSTWPPARSLVQAGAIAALFAHVAYYILIVGGDHFEYRVLSQLVPLIALLFVRSTLVFSRRGVATSLCATLLVVGNVIPWTHWQLTRNLNTRKGFLWVPVAPALPQPFAALAAPFDALQHTLIDHDIGIRHQEHKVFRLWQESRYPSRAEGLRIRPRQGNPVHAYPCVGVAAWTLPRVYILDMFGLNDYVIARTPLPVGQGHGSMGHERHAPPGYAEAFMPNIQFKTRNGDGLIELPRRMPLTDDRIREIERRYRAIVDGLAAR